MPKKYESDKKFAQQYAYKKLKNILSNKLYQTLSPEQIEFPLGKRHLKINALVEINGLRMNLRQKDSGSKYIIVSSAAPLIVEKDMYDYVKKLSGYAAKSENGRNFKIGKHDGITEEKNLQLYDCISSKCSSEPFSKWEKFKEHGEKLRNRRGNFAALSLTEQALALLQIVNILKTGRSEGLDLSLIGESNKTCISKLGAVLDGNKCSSICLIDQSPTGLIEHRSNNLLEL